MSSLALRKLGELREEMTQLAITADGDDANIGRLQTLAGEYQQQLELYVAYLDENVSAEQKHEQLSKELEFAKTLEKRLNTVKTDYGKQLQTIQVGKKARKNY
ncbi:hypothetical protein SAMN06297229_0697 [Pseudidiomarina planktonica]|uniref:Uncharacterized protein n=1 Tax=Pseudidiomarina planktonica TaxID=1323738 RepID=A0A1Y6EQC0_9GAMM|nr:hypothetical protein [Pseudidiomarina planktonica]RUO65842.1 hypothetical protein CWI77_05275 [Pseudidiomarina planktonica]SMQ62363.1 hypothetical protein SAMN06297229_0697 [Pseudidiomarina planktonica]